MFITGCHWSQICTIPFNQLAGAVAWMLIRGRGVRHVVHCLDDFFTVTPAAEEAGGIRESVLQLLGLLGVGWSPAGVVGPSRVVTFLGVGMDSARQRLRLPDDKRIAICDELGQWLGRRRCTGRRLLSLIGGGGGRGLALQPKWSLLVVCSFAD